MKQSAYKTLPETPGVYLMKDEGGTILYVGKAGNLRRRVSSYFERPHDVRIEALVRKIEIIDFRETDTALEALILEAELIKKLTPPFNVREKDDKSFLWVEITKEKFPRVILVRGNKTGNGKLFGPFTSASNLRDALKILRRIFPWNSHASNTLGTFKRPCFDYEIGLCPGTCVNAIPREDYLNNIGRLELFFEGKKRQVIRSIEKEMAVASKHLDFEHAEKLRRQLFALKHIRDTALIGYRVWGMGSNKNYTPYPIPDTRSSWPLPDLVLIDGGLAQANAAKKVLMRAGLRIPIVGIAKGPERKRNDIIGAIPKGVTKATLVRVRDEAHRFAISYHKKLRSIRSLSR